MRPREVERQNEKRDDGRKTGNKREGENAILKDCGSESEKCVRMEDEKKKSTSNT